MNSSTRALRALLSGTIETVRSAQCEEGARIDGPSRRGLGRLRPLLRPNGGVTLLEMLVAFGLVLLVVALLWQAVPRAAETRSAEEKADDVRSIHLGLERMKRRLETARAILYPKAAKRPEPCLVFRDSLDRMTIWTLENGDLIERCWSPASTSGVEKQVLLPKVDGAFFDFRGPSERCVRLQIFLAGLSFITSIRHFNNTSRRSIEPLEEMFGP